MTWADLVSLRTIGPGLKDVFSWPVEEWSELGPEQRGQFRRKRALLVAKRMKFCNDSRVKGKKSSPGNVLQTSTCMASALPLLRLWDSGTTPFGGTILCSGWFSFCCNQVRLWMNLGARCLGLGEETHQWPRNRSMEHSSLRT